MECAFKNETCDGRLEVALRKDSGTLWDERMQAWFGTELRDYWRLCQSHHVRYDAGEKTGPKKGSHHGSHEGSTEG